jgi:hypothetical protein
MDECSSMAWMFSCGWSKPGVLRGSPAARHADDDGERQIGRPERPGVTLISARRGGWRDGGRAYCRHRRDAMAALAAARRTRRDERRAAVAPTVPYDLAQMLLPPIVAAYLGRYPGTHRGDRHNAQLDLLAEGSTSRSGRPLPS